jgi:hypothetical protein
MNATLWITLAMALLPSVALAQNSAHKPQAEVSNQQRSRTDVTGERSHSDDIEQLRADLQRLKVLRDQMRTNLAFVQTTQTPLKHQFELEADAWQVIVEQMERRLKKMEQNQSARAGQPY